MTSCKPPSAVCSTRPPNRNTMLRWPARWGVRRRGLRRLARAARSDKKLRPRSLPRRNRRCRWPRRCRWSCRWRRRWWSRCRRSTCPSCRLPASRLYRPRCGKTSARRPSPAARSPQAIAGANRAGHSAGLSLGQHDPGTRRTDLLDRARRREAAQAAPPEAAVSAEAGHLAAPTPPQSKSAGAAMPAAGQSGSQAESSQITPVADLNVAATPAESPAAAAPPAASTKLRRRHLLLPRRRLPRRRHRETFRARLAGYARTWWPEISRRPVSIWPRPCSWPARRRSTIIFAGSPCWPISRSGFSPPCGAGSEIRRHRCARTGRRHRGRDRNRARVDGRAQRGLAPRLHADHHARAVGAGGGPGRRR